jgi:predicted Rossmann fold nucleotide-binding protein DprA/Smf involved in DNA uptake
VLAALESAARHLHFGTHEPRFASQQSDPETDDAQPQPGDAALQPSRTNATTTTRTRPDDPAPPRVANASDASPRTLSASLSLSANQRRIVDALVQDLAVQDLVVATGLDVSTILAEALVLEVRGVISRSGSLYKRCDLGRSSA